MKNLFNKICKTLYFDTRDSKLLAKEILNVIAQNDLTNCIPVILCIGTDRATGDCLGPLVGESLENYNDNFIILGTLSNPVHALNLKTVINNIYSNIDNPFIIAIDAALGDSVSVGKVTLGNCPIFPGKGVNKKLPAIGDLSITGIVNSSGNHPSVLQSTRLYTVMQLSNCISSALKYVMDDEIFNYPYIR